MTLATRVRRHPRSALDEIVRALDEIDAKLDATVAAVKRGELDVRDLEWESELDSTPPHKVG